MTINSSLLCLLLHWLHLLSLHSLALLVVHNKWLSFNLNLQNICWWKLIGCTENRLYINRFVNWINYEWKLLRRLFATVFPGKRISEISENTWKGTRFVHNIEIRIKNIGRIQTLLRKSVKFLTFGKILWSRDSPL